MVITCKHDGTLCRTVDLSLNRCCQREIFASETPFKLSRRVPRGTWKTVTDAWNGYHGIPLREKKSHTTAFITPFGTWRYTKAPQGFLQSGNGYNRRFNANCRILCAREGVLTIRYFTMRILKNIVGKHRVSYPSWSSRHRPSTPKFQFAQSNVDFAGVSHFPTVPLWSSTLSTFMQSKGSQPLLILQIYEAGPT